jgi:hypothetical protein
MLNFIIFLICLLKFNKIIKNCSQLSIFNKKYYTILYIYTKSLNNNKNNLN